MTFGQHTSHIVSSGTGTVSPSASSRATTSSIEPRFGWAPRTPSIPWLRRLDFSVQFRELVSLSSAFPGADPYLLGGRGGTAERQWQFNLLGVDLESGDGFDVTATQTYEYLDREFSPSGELRIAPGDYTIWEYRVFGRTAGRRRVSLFGGATVGGFWNGNRQQYGGRLSFRPNPGISLDQHSVQRCSTSRW